LEYILEVNELATRITIPLHAVLSKLVGLIRKVASGG
jgi:hypothetical protein